VNPDFRKVALIAAGLGLLVSLFFALRPNDDETTATQSTPATTEAPATTSEPPPTTQAPQVVGLEYVIVDGEPQGGIARDSVDRGQTIEITVTSDIADEVHVHGYDLMADVAPGAPATMRFEADAPGRFEIELENSGIQIAELEVRP
jgi:hypothetical protein